MPFQTSKQLDESFLTFNIFRYVPPLDHLQGHPMNIAIGFDNFEILKVKLLPKHVVTMLEPETFAILYLNQQSFTFQIDDREFTVEINAYLIVKWIDKRIEINIPSVSNSKYQKSSRVN